jgi:Rieske Fe-S protein
LYRFLSPEQTGKNTVDISISDIPENSVYLLRNKLVGVVRKGGDINVLSIACTHLGCALNVSGNIFLCPCHGSSFQFSGEVIKGPASQNLPKLRYEILNDTIRIYL